MPSKIEWTNETWNPVIGCSKISAGCQNCYAEKMACRLANISLASGKKGLSQYVSVTDCDIDIREYSPAGVWNGKTALVKSALDKPLRWKKPRRIFVCSMGDLFHETVPFEWVDRVLAIAWQCRRHTFQVLTKRPGRMAEYFSPDNPRYSGRKIADRLPPGTFGDFDCDMNWPIDNLWLGVTAENQETADKRIPVLLQIPAAVRFVSVEPMLGPVDLSPWLPHFLDFSYTTDPARLDWVICGGESGPGARPMKPEWARSLRDQCQAAEVPFFVKQWGNFCHPDQMPADTYQKVDAAHNLSGHGDYNKPWHVGKKAAGRLLDGHEWNEFPSST